MHYFFLSLFFSLILSYSSPCYVFRINFPVYKSTFSSLVMCQFKFCFCFHLSQPFFPLGLLPTSWPETHESSVLLMLQCKKEKELKMSSDWKIEHFSTFSWLFNKNQFLLYPHYFTPKEMEVIRGIMYLMVTLMGCMMWCLREFGRGLTGWLHSLFSFCADFIISSAVGFK